MVVDVIIASHLSLHFRTLTLKKCVEALYEQTKKPYNVYLSYSDDPTLVLDTDEYEKELKELCPILCIRRREKRHTQFQHIERILEEESLNEWVAFHDDDDISTPNRFEDFVSNVMNDTECYVSKRIRRIQQNFETLSEEISNKEDFGCFICKTSTTRSAMNKLKDSSSLKTGSPWFDVLFQTYMTSEFVSTMYGKIPTYVHTHHMELCYAEYPDGRYNSRKSINC